MTNIENFNHQGDIPFYGISDVAFQDLKATGKPVKHSGRQVLALGETTGHKHVITCERPEAMEVFGMANGQWLMKLDMSATVTHEEHLPIILNPGIYFVGKEREYDWFSKSTRRVID